MGPVLVLMVFRYSSRPKKEIYNPKFQKSKWSSVRKRQTCSSDIIHIPYHGTIGVNGEMSEIYDNCYYKYNFIEIKARPTESEKSLVYEIQLSNPIKINLLNKQQDSHIQEDT